MCLNNGKLYDCIQDAADEVNVYASNISECLYGNINYAAVGENGEKLVWAFKEDYDKMPIDDIADADKKAIEGEGPTLTVSDSIDPDNRYSIEDSLDEFANEKDTFYFVFACLFSFVLCRLRANGGGV